MRDFLIGVSLLVTFGLTFWWGIVLEREREKDRDPSTDCSSMAAKEALPMYEYRATIVRVIDGDTLDVDIDLGFHVHIKERLRVARVDTPEIRGEERPEGLKSSAFVKANLPVGEVVRIRTQKTGKFGRWLAEVWYNDEDGVPINLSDELLKRDLAKPYGEK